MNIISMWHSTVREPADHGTDTVRTVDRTTFVPNESRTIDTGAAAPWNSLMWPLMTAVCHAMGVRTAAPFREQTNIEKEIVYNATEKNSGCS